MTPTEVLKVAAEVRAAAANGTMRDRRHAANVTTPELARALGVSVPTLSRWERGLARPTLEHALLWREALDTLAVMSDSDAGRGERRAAGGRR